MDEETEKRIAKLIIEEAAMQRKQADREGVHIYLTKPTARVRPNPQFLRATIRSVEQSNRIVEVNEMWRRRNAELQSDRSRKRRNDDETRSGSSRASSSSHRSSRDRDRDRHTDREREDGRRKSSRHHRDRSHSEDEDDTRDKPTCSGELRDEEVEQFLNKRVKRGRGSVGSRMDETGPYPAPTASVPEVPRTKEDWEKRLIGPRLPEKAETEWKRPKPGKPDKSKEKSRNKKMKHEEEKKKEASSSSN